jgi:hypothetical protein
VHGPIVQDIQGPRVVDLKTVPRNGFVEFPVKKVTSSFCGQLSEPQVLVAVANCLTAAVT